MSSSAAQTAVATPNRTPTAPIQESPGTWRHPRLAEIHKRQEAFTFSEKNMTRIAFNICALAALVGLKAVASRFFAWNLPELCVLSLSEPDSQSQLHLHTHFHTHFHTHTHVYTYTYTFPAALQPTMTTTSTSSNSSFNFRLATWAWRLFVLVCFIPVFNIVSNCFPLVRNKDDLSDIPLTPGQRRLLGLPPSSRPPTPGSAYSTPPRFSRTPSVGSASSRRSFSTSPASNRGSPVLGSGSLYGTANGNGNNGNFSGSFSGSVSGSGGGGFAGIGSPSSPLLQKAMNGARRSSIGSLGSPTPSFGASLGASSLFVPDSPSPNPAAGKRSSIGLNSKWLYEKGRERRASGNARLFS